MDFDQDSPHRHYCFPGVAFDTMAWDSMGDIVCCLHFYKRLGCLKSVGVMNYV